MNFSKFLFISFLFSISSSAQVLEQKSSIKILITDQKSDEQTAVRIKITDSKGVVTALPEEVVAVMYGRDDTPERYGYQPDESFYVGGLLNLNLEAGTYHIYISKGMEYLDQSHEIELKEGEHKELKFEMERWVDMSEKGWYSADEHIHIRRSPRENPLLLKWMDAEGLNVGVLLQMGDIWTTYFSQYSFGEEGVYREKDVLLTSGQEEPRTHEIGHTVAMLADDFYRDRDNYYLYSSYFDKIHELNGIVGYAHQGKSFNGVRGMTLDVLDDKVDFLELIQFCVEGAPLVTKNYYHYLDLGYKLTATSGSDFPYCWGQDWVGSVGLPWTSRIGDVRFYTYVDGDFSYRGWNENVKAGHTFVTSGPMLQFSVNDKIPGDELNLEKKEKVTISAKAFGDINKIPLTRLEIVSHGKVIKEIIPNNSDQTSAQLTLDYDLEVENGTWIAARCYAGPIQIAHTTPVYISVGGKGFHNQETLQEYLVLNEKYLDELEAEIAQPSEKIDYRAGWFKDSLEGRIVRAREIINTLRENNISK